MELPTESDINVYNSQDELAARDHFLNKTVEEAEALFRDNSAYYQEDLMWMGPRAFAYYLRAALRYLQSPHSVGDDHMIDSLYEIIRFRSDQEDFSLALDGVKELADYVISHYDKFNVDREIYGDLLEKYKQLESQLEG
jgi:hypothetical protein